MSISSVTKIQLKLRSWGVEKMYSTIKEKLTSQGRNDKKQTDPKIVGRGLWETVAPTI